jgi:PadR family transcriptional regulator, regulatory protein AphA
MDSSPPTAPSKTAPARVRDENRSRYAILGALTLGPKSGYDLRQFFARNLAFFWSESFGQIYPILRTLSAEGLVEADAVAGERRRPYHITDAGREALARWLAQPPAMEIGRVEVLLKLIFAGEAPPEATHAHLQVVRAEHAQRLAQYEQVARRLDTELASRAETVYWRLTLDYGRRVSEALVAWCDAAEQTLRDAAGARAPR